MEVLKKSLGVFALMACIIPLTVYATDYSSSNFKVLDPVIKSGAGFSTSTSFQLWSAVGQDAIGISSATNFGLRSGFLYFPAIVVTTTTPSSSQPETITVIGGGGGVSVLFKERKPGSVELYRPVDFNNDSGISLGDLSILLFFYGKRGAGIAKYDLNHNGVVDFPDISILLYYWTDLS